MSYDEAAKQLSNEIRADGRGYLTITKGDLRERFDQTKITNNISDAIVEALGRYELLVFPEPYYSGATLRLYDANHELGQIARAVTGPDAVTDAALGRAAEVYRKERAGREVRSDDVPWIEAFDIYLQLIFGREPDEWEDLRHERHGAVLAGHLAGALGLDPAAIHQPRMITIAVAACCLRPRRRTWRAKEFAGVGAPENLSEDLLTALETRDRRAREDTDRVLLGAARLVLSGAAPPSAAVDLGALGLRRRRDTEED